MKKLIVIAFAVALLFCIQAHAADVGTCTETLEDGFWTKIAVVKLDCTAATGDIVRTLTSSPKIQGAMLQQVDIGLITAPTAASDLYIYNDNGTDVAAG